MAAPVLFRHPASFEHEPGPHPEQPARLAAIERELEARDWLGFDVRASPEATREQLQRVHPERHVNGIQELCAAGGGAIDADTIVSPGSWEAALHGAGGAVAVVDALLGDGAPFAASLHRPPGHHCEPAQAMGFCLFASVAIACRHALAAHGVSRVMVLDWDVHHGNGTEACLLEEPAVLFVSVHESPLYPGTGAATDIGYGAGTGFTVNLPVPGGSGDEVWTSLVEHVAAPLGRAYAPELVLLSAGFDAHLDDPLASCRVSDAGFVTMATSARALGASLGAPVGFILEGGYALHALARGVANTLEVLGGASAGLEVLPGDPHPLAVAANERLARVTPFV